MLSSIAWNATLSFGVTVEIVSGEEKEHSPSSNRYHGGGFDAITAWHDSLYCLSLSIHDYSGVLCLFCSSVRVNSDSWRGAVVPLRDDLAFADRKNVVTHKTSRVLHGASLFGGSSIKEQRSRETLSGISILHFDTVRSTFGLLYCYVFKHTSICGRIIEREAMYHTGDMFIKSNDWD
jgi:hypothetical protein